MYHVQRQGEFRIQRDGDSGIVYAVAPYIVRADAVVVDHHGHGRHAEQADVVKSGFHRSFSDGGIACLYLGFTN